MRYANDFPISFPYNGVPYELYETHHGIDYAAPEGVPIKLRDTVIGLTGNTGLSTGPHLHVDKKLIGAPANQRISYLNPGSDWHTIGGQVVFAGEAGTAGKMVVIHYLTYEFRFLHLSLIGVEVGDVIQGGSMGAELNDDDFRNIYKDLHGKWPSSKEIADYKTWYAKDKEMFWYQTVLYWIRQKNKTIADLAATVERLQSQANNDQYEVVKEIYVKKK